MGWLTSAPGGKIKAERVVPERRPKYISINGVLYQTGWQSRSRTITVTFYGAMTLAAARTLRNSLNAQANHSAEVNEQNEAGAYSVTDTLDTATAWADE